MQPRPRSWCLYLRPQLNLVGINPLQPPTHSPPGRRSRWRLPLRLPQGLLCQHHEVVLWVFDLDALCHLLLRWFYDLEFHLWLCGGEAALLLYDLNLLDLVLPYRHILNHLIVI